MKKHVRIYFYLYILFLGIGFSSCDVDEIEPLPEQVQHRSAKRGVSYNFQIPTDDANLLAKGVSWFYNWGPNISAAVNTATSLNKIDFLPMAWNGNFNAAEIRAFKQLHPECEYILGFNEPNLTDQANMSPVVAAQKWIPLAALAKELDMKIISPAMNYGTLSGYSDPIVWLDEFFTLVPLSGVDGIAIHCYMGNASAMASYVKRFKKYGKPIWLTEFCAWEKNITNVNAQMFYLSEAINYLESNPDVVRYAWFIPRASGIVESYPYMQLLTKNAPYDLSELGKVFVNMSTLDKTIYYPELQKIPAEHYSSLSMETAVKEGNWSASVHLRPTTDVDGVLDVTDLNSDMWLEYLIETFNIKNPIIEIRYTSLYNSNIEISVDGKVTSTLALPKTGAENAWTTMSTSLPMSIGKHTIRVKNIYGGTSLNWIRISK
ncbi:MAG TPA: glycosyl hydrolase [Paludibacter sp.]|nr:glycosyl hydrolase [Paludibacter sp.]